MAPFSKRAGSEGDVHRNLVWYLIEILRLTEVLNKVYIPIFTLFYFTVFWVILSIDKITLELKETWK